MISADQTGKSAIIESAHRWEVGGDFPQIPLPCTPFIRFPTPSVYFALGRHCIAALLGVLPTKRERSLWIPSFFCHDVAKYWSQFIEIKYYLDDPRDSEPKWKSITPNPQDIVISVNYFGVRDTRPWDDWHKKKSCVLVEDQSHDPLSEFALNSQADYVFSSLRKTLPIPDGAVLWSPVNSRLPAPVKSSEVVGAKEKLSAMCLKADFLQGRGDLDLKTKYRAQLYESEIALESTSPEEASSFTQKYVYQGIPVQWRERRTENVKHLINELNGWPVVALLFSAWPNGSAPFALPLIFKNSSERDYYRAFLISHDVYCPIHWQCQDAAFSQSCELSSRILTLPADQRYQIADMGRVVRILFEAAATKGDVLSQDSSDH